MSVLDDLGAWLGERLDLPHLPAHFRTIVLSLEAFTGVYIASALMSPFIAPEIYPRLSRRTKHSWNVHAVSMVHALVIGPMAAYRLLTLPEVDTLEKAFGWDEGMGFLHGIAVGYFIWDTIESILAQVDIGFIIHGLACTLIFGMSYRPFMAFYGPCALIWELSTPFLNIHVSPNPIIRYPAYANYCVENPNSGGLLQAINGFVLLALFFIVRICFGIYMSIEFFNTLFAVQHVIPIGLTLIYGIGSISLNLLNLYWFSKMIAAIRKRFQKGSRRPEPSSRRNTTRKTRLG